MFGTKHKALVKKRLGSWNAIGPMIYNGPIGLYIKLTAAYLHVSVLMTVHGLYLKVEPAL